MQLVTLSRFLVRSPLESCKLLIVVTSCGEEFPQTAQCEEPLPYATCHGWLFSVILTLVLEELMDAADSLVPSSALLQVGGLYHTSSVLIYLREVNQNCA